LYNCKRAGVGLHGAGVSLKKLLTSSPHAFVNHKSTTITRDQDKRSAPRQIVRWPVQVIIERWFQTLHDQGHSYAALPILNDSSTSESGLVGWVHAQFLSPINTILQAHGSSLGWVHHPSKTVSEEQVRTKQCFLQLECLQ